MNQPETTFTAKRPPEMNVRGGAELGEHTGLPQAGVDRGDHLQFLGREQQREAEACGLVLVLGAVAGHVADLAERVLEAALLGQLRELAVVLDAPVGALLDLGDDQAAADIGHPVGELDRILACDRHLRPPFLVFFDCFYELCRVRRVRRARQVVSTRGAARCLSRCVSELRPACARAGAEAWWCARAADASTSRGRTAAASSSASALDVESASPMTIMWSPPRCMALTRQAIVARAPGRHGIPGLVLAEVDLARVRALSPWRRSGSSARAGSPRGR